MINQSGVNQEPIGNQSGTNPANAYEKLKPCYGFWAPNTIKRMKVYHKTRVDNHRYLNW